MVDLKFLFPKFFNLSFSNSTICQKTVHLQTTVYFQKTLLFKYDSEFKILLWFYRKFYSNHFPVSLKIVIPLDRPLLTKFHQNISFPREANTQIGYSTTTVIYKLTVIAMGVFSICVNIAENFKCWFTYIIAIHNLFFVVPTHTPNKPSTKINFTWCSIKDTMN